MPNTALLQQLCMGNPNGPSELDDYPAGLWGAPAATFDDSFGYGNRMCGSYVAAKVYAAGQQIQPFSVLGFPGDWPAKVDSAWLVTTPQPGDIAVIPANADLPKGHAMYVSAICEAGNLVTKSYNTGDLGCFQLAVWASSGVVGTSPFTMAFIRFPALGG